MTARMWNHLSTTDFFDLDREQALVLMPFGSTEQHGPHLPVGTDLFLVEEVLRRVKPRLEDLDVLILPTLWCTKSNEHAAFAGSLYLKAETMMAMVHDIAASVRRSGFQKLVMMNWHGGNSDLLTMMALDIRQRHDLLVFLIDALRVFFTFRNKEDEDRLAFHAGFYETSMMLAAYPNLVKPGPFEGVGSDLKRGRMAKSFADHDTLNPEGGLVRVSWETTDLTEDGVIGDPAGSNADDGERELEAQAVRVEDILREIATFEYRS